jgi:hypothetical protein
MRFDDEGHLLISPRELQDFAFADPHSLINDVLLPGTPRVCATYEAYCDLLHQLSTRLGVHPRNLLFKGSTKIGFSIAPRPEKLWRQFGPTSDLDLAIVDANFFNRLDEQVRQWERDPRNRRLLFRRDPRWIRSYRLRVEHKGRYECYRFFDLPRVPLIEEVVDRLSRVKTVDYCGTRRELTAFIFRDLWGVFQRYEYDLDDLRFGLRFGTPRLPQAGAEPRPHDEVEIE